MTYTLALNAADEALIERFAARENLSVPDFMLRATLETIERKQPNAETMAAIEEVRRMKADPSLGKTYTDVDEMMRELLA